MDSILSRDKLTLSETLKAYLELTKLRIVLLLCFTTVTTMIVAARGLPEFDTLVFTLFGGILAAGGSSALNQYLDRDMDAKMTRTARRPIPSGRISPINALMFGLMLVMWSVLVLVTLVNPLTGIVAFVGSLYYVVLYTMVLKRNTVVNILIGGGAGAFPVLVGWAAVQNSLSFEAFLLFAIIFYWTPPHSWALALLVNRDYAAANVPMMPVARGEQATRVQIVLYSIQLLLITLVPAAFGVFGWIYVVLATALGVGLVYKSIQLLYAQSKALARSTYKY
ncbi:MAG: protoheme IX farnesyltransferase, partial [Phototrophicales bacterium]